MSSAAVIEPSRDYSGTRLQLGVAGVLRRKELRGPVGNNNPPRPPRTPNYSVILRCAASSTEYLCRLLEVWRYVPKKQE